MLKKAKTKTSSAKAAVQSADTADIQSGDAGADSTNIQSGDAGADSTNIQSGDTGADSTDIQLDSGNAAEAEDLGLVDAQQAAADTQVDDTDVPSMASAGTVADKYYTAKDGLIKVNTNGHTGYYLFDESGIMVTGRITREPGNLGYSGKTTREYYMAESSTAKLYAGCEGQNVTPWTSDLGQQKRGYWLWTGSNFRYYGMKGYYISIPDLEKVGKSIIGKNKKIDGAFYNLDKNGVPYVGIKTVKKGSGSYQYYYQPASDDNDIPGKMFYGGWTSVQGNKGTRWIYCNPRASKFGQILKHGVYISRIKSKKYSFLIDANGYILKNTMAKTENGNYYATDAKGHVRKSKMVRNSRTGERYYFGSNGRRAPWTNGWHRCKGASNRLYYFGSTPGKVEERYGWQKIYTTSGVYCGWYYFNKNGNHYMNTWVNNKYYFDAKGKSASGITTIDGKKYFFATSSEASRRGWIYKNTLIRYNNNWYFASKNGVLRQRGWQKVGSYWYYLDNYVVQTNQAATRNGANGYLDSQGRFITKSEWVIVNDYNNEVKYLYQGKYLVNTSMWIDGKLYYFDKNGYRRNDITSIYGGPYYVEVDRVNGVMTVYTDSSRQIPVKTIRVSVGLPGTPTWTGTYSLSRSARWQPLMGPSWGQYGTHVDGCGQGGIFVHSIACAEPNNHNLSTAEYLKLGNPASHGCIRVCVADAKWVYDNCNGATIRIFDGTYDSRETFKGPLGRKPIVPLVGIGNYDPTDPAYN